MNESFFTFLFTFTPVAPKIMHSTLLCWTMTLEVDVGGNVVEFEPFCL